MANNNNPAEALHIVTRAEVKPGHEESFEKAFQKAAGLSREEKGNLTYQLLKVHDRERQYVVSESWANGDALHAHMEEDHTKELFKSLEEDLTHKITEHLLVTSELYPSI